ncbi:TonB-dependent receptor domain-containing protein [Erythrobacter sp.]|jgi:outer membrane receptor protein involved in Fe transport|uniref:TonB-dependent receptor domain-containing protein n=1 Tax=Erythrobacter sp. TaxID=1042 RepID=UPI002E9CBD05|nr:TonB-dependent receptor [Erythrobacter sp.]
MRFNKGSLLAGTMMASAMIATPAMAQDTDVDPAIQSGADQNADTDNFITVTGSRIQQRNVETAAPIAVVEAEEFKLTGAVNVENVINALPQTVPGTTAFSNNPGNGAATLNLRGLGATRTLVLVNGRRWVSFDTNQIVDLNTIPQFLIESVDTVTGGASAVYGSDALAGVVNFRLKKVEGVEFGGQYSLTERGDGARYQMYGAIGTSFDDGRGNATVFAEYFNRESIFQGDRAFSANALGGETIANNPALQAFGSSTLPTARFNAPTEIGIVDGADCDIAGQCAPLADGLVIDDAIFDTPGVGRARAGDTYNYAPVNYLQIPQERYLLGGYADYEFTDGHRAYTEVAFVNNRVAQELAATPVTGTFNIDIATVAPFLDAATLAELNQLDANEAAASAARVANGLPALAGAELGVVQASIQRRVLETGARNTLDERNAFRVLAGVEGAITDNLNYDFYYSYARTRNANVQQGNVSRSAFQAGLDGTGDVALNIFGAGTLTPEMVDSFSITAQNGDVSTTEVAAGTVSGFLGNLGFGGGDIGFAVGAEYRRVAAEFIPDTALASGDVIGFNAGSPTEGAYDVKELFAEIDVPIFETDGGVRLGVNGAARYSDYSLDNVGGVWTYAGGVQFVPTPGVLLRGQYQRAVRAPNVAELFQGQAIGFPAATDPCGNANFIADNPGAAQTCIDTGVPAGNVGNGAAVQLNAQIPALFGGNPDLGEETSTSFTGGVVFQPSFVPGLTVTADYFNIEVEDFITIAGGSLQGLLNLCYGQVQDINTPACQPFVGIRNLDGAITVDAPPLVSGVNAAELQVSGIDLQVNYRADLPFSLLTDTGNSRFNVNFLGTWTDQNDFTPVAGLPQVDQCAGAFGGNCGQPIPSFKWTSRFTWVDGPLTTSVRWRHLSGTDDALDTVDFAAVNGIERIGAYDLIDLTFSVEATENVTISAGINNLFDTLPGTPNIDANGIVTNRPNSLLLGDNQEQANTFPSVFDVLGRDFFISAAFSF